MRKGQCVTVLGRRWFEQTNGNTYHSVQVFVDNKRVAGADFRYGYGSQFETTALELLQENCNANAESSSHGGLEPLWVWAKRRGMKLLIDVVDVGRKKDL